jgi:RNA polymerase sigma-70 factor (ECF subfamily)
MEESEWIRAAQRGDQAAISHLVESYERLVYVVCYRMLGNATDAEDAAQESFMKAITNLDSFDVERPLRPWLLTITSNLCRDRLRRRKPTLSLDGMGEDGAWEWQAGSSPNPEREVLRQEKEAQVQQVLETLKPLDRAVVTLFYWQDLSYREIAEATNLTESAVKSRLFRARRSMAQLLMEEEEAHAVHA